MGCSLSVVPRSPKKGGVGLWVEGEKQPTLVEKWIEFREWVRRNRGKKTKVVPINIKPCEWGVVKSLSNTAVVEGDAVSVMSVSSSLCPVDGQQSSQNVASWLNQLQVTMDTNCYSPVPGTVTRKTRPKAAKGTRTIVPPLEDQVRIPGAIISDEELDTGKPIPDRVNLGRGRCPVILQLGEETCVPVEGERKESQQKVTVKSGGFWRRLRPKAAKGKRSISSVQGQQKVLKHQSDSQQACLDSWMQRKLVQEGGQ